MRQENCIVDLLMYRIRELGFVLGKCERTCFQASSILAGQGQELITIFSKFFHEILQEWIKYSIFGFEMKWKLWNVCSEGGSRCGALCLYQGAVPRYHWESTPPQREYWHQKVFKNELKSWEQSRNCYIEPHKINIWTFSALTFTTKYPINFPFRRRCLEKKFMLIIIFLIPISGVTMKIQVLSFLSASFFSNPPVIQVCAANENILVVVGHKSNCQVTPRQLHWDKVVVNWQKKSDMRRPLVSSFGDFFSLFTFMVVYIVYCPDKVMLG